ncbi:hypothetical protein EWM64_g3 [Hericium alpestre]|uniref:Tethering factor for nuclear proteasome STS1 n=1 Tax=Hericium alpestre TaxID=135208 RepID=A0A4Z0AC55_9AGAM|nr:hypothetical protein EWM64_g3 [Hericium alpestre]
MANLVHSQPHVELHTRPVNHSPTPFGFGFGLSSSSMIARPASNGHGAFTHPAALQQLASNLTQHPSRSTKRRFDHDEENESGGISRHGSRDDAMDRSPTPERPKRGVPKKARMTPTSSTGAKDGHPSKDRTDQSDQDVDVGFLLASLPSQSLLPLLNSLIQSQPSLKPLVLSLIPRPSLDTALQALSQSAKKLRDAYPYSNTPLFSQPTAPASFGFGFGSSPSSRSSTGFGHISQSPHVSGFNTPSGPDSNSGGMRDEYIVSRTRPYISDFVAACMSYFPYFSYVAAPPTGNAQLPTSLQSLHRDKSHPTETFAFLSTLTSHILSQPPLTQASLVPLILPRLLEEWRAWVDRVSDVVNKEGGMFGGETVRGWESSLDEFAEAKGHGLEALREAHACSTMYSEAAERAGSRTRAGGDHSASGGTSSSIVSPRSETEQYRIDYVPRNNHGRPAIPVDPNILAGPSTRTYRDTTCAAQPGTERASIDQDRVQGMRRMHSQRSVSGPVDVGRLSHRDMTPTSGYILEDDIYADVVREAQLSRFKTVRAGPIEELPPARAAVSRDISSRDAFARSLRAQLFTAHPPSLKELVSQHASHPDLQTTQSFNLVIDIAIRHTIFTVARQLIRTMQDANIDADLETWKLYVRLLVREGRWEEAWEAAMSRRDGWLGAGYEAGKPPLDVYFELLGRTNRGARGRRRDDWPNLDPGMANLDRYEVLMRSVPSAAPQADHPPGWVIRASVEALLRMGERESAMGITSHFLGHDPGGLGLRLLHTHLGIKQGLCSPRTFNKARRELLHFCKVCPELRPDAKALFLLLGHLQRSKRGAKIGNDMAKMFRRRWGERTMSPQVMRRLLELAVVEGRTDIILRSVAAGRARQCVEEEWAKEREVLGDSWRPESRRRKVFARIGSERVKWRGSRKRAAQLLRRVAAEG